MAPTERTVGDKIKRDTHNNMGYNKNPRKLLVGELYDNAAMDTEKAIKLKYLRGMNTDDELKVDEEILQQIKVLHGGDVYEELLNMEKSKFSLTSIMPEEEIEKEIGAFPAFENFQLDQMAKAAPTVVKVRIIL